jgi:predicted Zn-dependent protease
MEALAALGNFVDYLNRKGDEQKALEVLEDLLNNDPERVAIHRTLAEQYQRMGRSGDAIAQWDEVGDRLLNAGDKIGALHAIRSIVNLNPPNVSEYERLIEELERNS